MVTLGWALSHVMAARQMSIAQLRKGFDDVGVRLSRQTVFRLVRRQPERVSVRVLGALCTMLDCTPDDLFLAAKSAPPSLTRVPAPPPFALGEGPHGASS
jgi:DNA-binding Xre family transcriptional regulator